MSKNKIVILTCVICLLITAVSFADEILPPNEITYGPVRKLGRGVQNISIGVPLQFFKDIDDTYKQDGVIAAATVGTIKGFVKGATRLFVGIYETLTFIIPGPEDYKPVMNDPEFFLQTDPEFPEDAPTADSSR